MHDIDIVKKNVNAALLEDIGHGDVTARLLDNREVIANIIAREPCIIAGIPWAIETLAQLSSDLKSHWLVQEGEAVDANTVIVEIKGPSRLLMTAERTMLNFLQFLSATATATSEYVHAINDYSCHILDTRKTIPGLRYAQKYAVKVGGGENHRFGLYDAILIKENHIRAMGSIENAILKARELTPDLFLEIEVESLDELKTALPFKPDRILCDNFSIDMLIDAVQLASSYQVPLEASGGVSLETVKHIASTGVQFISIGQITKSVKAVDLSLLVID